MRGRRLLLFTRPWSVEWAEEHNEDLRMSEFGNVSME